MQYDVDAVVIGAGFGGLGAALTLAEAGARVLVAEALAYPGGCASTFQRKGARFEAGATLFAGLGEDQLFGRWIRENQLPVRVDRLDPVIELRAPGLDLPIPADRRAWVESLCALPGAPAAPIRDFFALQARVAQGLWGLLDDPSLLPPWTAATFGRLLGRLPSLLPALRWAGLPLLAVLERYGLASFAPLRLALDGLCQITVQCDAARAEAPFALGVLDYPFRGAGHVRGGAGALADGLVQAVVRRGAEVRLATRVRGLRREGDRWVVDARGQTVRAPIVLANLLPQALATLAPDTPLPSPVRELAARVETGWSALMLYATLPADAARPGAHHLELVADPSAPLVEGNHVFCSVSDAEETERAPAGQRTLTASTHVSAPRWRALSPEQQARAARQIQDRMVATIRRLAPGLLDDPPLLMTASPRTFERFTRRPGGLVGGVPRTAGLWGYHPRLLYPTPVAPGLLLVGDTVFPGQSALAAAIGGQRAATAALRAYSPMPART